jgi:cysteine-rich repeat protein
MGVGESTADVTGTGEGTVDGTGAGTADGTSDGTGVGTTDGTTTGGPPLGCGNGEIDEGEDCDDAGESATCNADCTPVECGDGITNMTAGEECDTAGASDECNADCTTTQCGDGVHNPEVEECDDGGESATCDSDCTLVLCGDTVVNQTAGEECDEGMPTPSCDEDCTNVLCGDGVVNVAFEECDDGGESAACNADCSFSICGDGVTNMTDGEDCDDMGESLMCDADCTAAMCGDGVLNTTADEECDDGTETAFCDADCTAPECGDGVLNTTDGEQCDDAGVSATCDADCTPAVCGDGVLNLIAGESCDDGNPSSNDGCSSTCQPDCDDSPGNNDCASALRLPPVGVIDLGESFSVNGLVGYAGARDYVEVVFAANDAMHRTGSKLPGMLRIYVDDPLAPGSPAEIANTNVRFRVFEDIVPSGCQNPLNYTVPFNNGLTGTLQANATNDTSIPGPGYATLWEWSDTCDPLDGSPLGDPNNCGNAMYTAPHPLPITFWVEVLPVPGMPDACVPYTLVATWQ